MKLYRIKTSQDHQVLYYLMDENLIINLTTLLVPSSAEILNNFSASQMQRAYNPNNNPINLIYLMNHLTYHSFLLYDNLKDIYFVIFCS